MQLAVQEAIALIEQVGPRLGSDHTHTPVFPDGYDNVCVIRHSAEDAAFFGYDILYLVWKEDDGEIRHLEIGNTRGTKDYLHIQYICVERDAVIVGYRSLGSSSGVQWSRTVIHGMKSGATVSIGGNIQNSTSSYMRP